MIVDCTSVLTGNVLATAALEVADDVLRVCGCDLKAISYWSATWATEITKKIATFFAIPFAPILLDRCLA